MRRPSRGARLIADFDSSSAMVRALAAFLRGDDFRGIGMLPGSRLLGRVVNAVPGTALRLGYVWGGWKEAVPQRRVVRLRGDDLARALVSGYPRRRHPAVAIGSANGAATHLWAALGIPWLPQTALVPVRHHVDPDQPTESLDATITAGRSVVAANPELCLHHMHDTNQDRLMVRRMSYFRLKRHRLGEAYTKFLDDVLDRGSTIFLLECTRTWPTTRVDDRYVFQHGALGGATEDEYLHGGPRVAQHLRDQGSAVRRWRGPEPDADRPEAEWGFDPELRADVERYARRHGHRVRRIVFDDPEDLSPLVADLHRWWHRRRGLPADRLLVESFILMDPWWALRTGSVPFWTTFNTEVSVAAIERYLDSVEPFDDIETIVFAHGTEGVGLPPAERWRAIADRARRHGRLLGFDERSYPAHFGVFFSFNDELQQIPDRHPLPPPLAEAGLDEFLAEAGDRYDVAWK